jgi:isovaleryl-CoA dehydrogenase
MSTAMFDLTEEQREILTHAERFARDELGPLGERMDAEEWWPDEVFPKLGEVGYLGITAPPELGGAGLDLFTSGVIGQAIAKYNPAVALSWGAHENLCLNNILRNADDDQRARFIPKLASGEWVGALGLTEPGAGSDALGAMRTTATRDGDDYVLNGRKLWITNGPIADVVLVYAKTAPERGAKGISAFVVERGSPGFSVAQKIKKMGFRGSPTGELVFEDCRVPAANRLGPENTGVGVLMSGLDLERAFLAVCAIGFGERALELTIDYAGQREQFGRPIASFQLIRAKIADMYVALESARSLVYRVLAACNELEQGGGGRGEIHKLSAASLLYAGRAFKQLVDDAVQVHGGMGYAWESEINRLYRAAKLFEIGAGTNEVRQIIISDELLRS